MKKLLTLFLALTMVLSLAACGGKTGSASPSDLPTAPVTPTAANALELMQAVWAKYGEDEKFPILGGDLDNASEEGPGVYGVGDPAMLDSDFALPASAADKVDDAASIRHMMNANTFTAVAFHVKSAVDVVPVADALKESVTGRQWMCGFPDKLVVILVGEYVVSVFGNEELVDNFQARTSAAYETATVAYDEPLI